MSEVFEFCGFADEADPSVDGQIRALKRNGMTLLEIRGVDGTNIADISEEKAKEVRKKLDDGGISVWSLGSPFGKIKIGEPFGPHMEKFRRGLENSAVLGTKHIRMFSFYLDPGQKREDVFPEVCRRISAFAEAAEPYGILLCHENEKGIYGENASQCLEILQAEPRLRAVFDPANFVQVGQETLSAYRMLEPYTEYLHIKDALSTGEVVLPGTGEGKLPELLSLCGKGVLTLEPHLKVFDGLAGLEQGGTESKVGAGAYPSGDAAFDAACLALRKITGAIG